MWRASSALRAILTFAGLVQYVVVARNARPAR
jgi:hypothetical protein